MSGRQLADRLDVKPPRITEMQTAEIHGNVTLKTLRNAAEAMDCVLVYAIVPKTNLELTLRKQATHAASANFKNVSHTMKLEDQDLNPKEDAYQMESKINEWVAEPPRWLWDIK